MFHVHNYRQITENARCCAESCVGHHKQHTHIDTAVAGADAAAAMIEASRNAIPIQILPYFL